LLGTIDFNSCFFEQAARWHALNPTDAIVSSDHVALTESVCRADRPTKGPNARDSISAQSRLPHSSLPTTPVPYSRQRGASVVEGRVFSRGVISWG
jgi:hypothetical protein